MIKAIVADFDGVLADVESAYEATLKRVKKNLGCEYQTKDFAGLFGKPLKEIAEALVGAEGADAFVDAYLEAFASTKKTTPTPGRDCKTIYKYAKARGILTGIGNVAQPETLEETMKAIGLNKELVDVIVPYTLVPSMGETEVTPTLAANMMKVAPEELLYITDKVEMVRACKAAGVVVMGVTWGATPRYDMWAEDRDYSADHGGEMAALLEAILDQDKFPRTFGSTCNGEECFAKFMKEYDEVNAKVDYLDFK